MYHSDNYENDFDESISEILYSSDALEQLYFDPDPSNALFTGDPDELYAANAHLEHEVKKLSKFSMNLQKENENLKHKISSFENQSNINYLSILCLAFCFGCVLVFSFFPLSYAFSSFKSFSTFFLASVVMGISSSIISIIVYSVYVFILEHIHHELRIYDIIIPCLLTPFIIFLLSFFKSTN